MSDAAIKKATGCDWEKWVFCLDYVGAQDWSHRAIADHVHTAYKVKDWWTQTVTVGYERIKGLRAIGQRRDGGFEANKSKTLNASAAAVFRAFAHARVRKHWLPGVKVTVQKGDAESIRAHDCGMTARRSKSGLCRRARRRRPPRSSTASSRSKEDADSRKKYWDERLAALRDVVE